MIGSIPQHSLPRLLPVLESGSCRVPRDGGERERGIDFTEVARVPRWPCGVLARLAGCPCGRPINIGVFALALSIQRDGIVSKKTSISYMFDR